MDGELVYTGSEAIPSDFEDFHIYLYQSDHDAQWLNQIYTGLVERNPLAPYNRSHAPRLASSISSSDGITYDVYINPNAKFADGHVLNASDVKYSYELFADIDICSHYYDDYCVYISNESVSIIDEFHVKIKFLQQYIFQNNHLTLPILPKHIWEEVNPADHETQASTWATSNPEKLIGAGPYSFVEFNFTSEVIHLERNDFFDDWSGDVPYFNDIYFEFWSNKEGALSALAAGVLDMVDAQFQAQLYEIPSGTSYSLIDEARTKEIAINMEHPILGTGELCPIAGPKSANYVRKAMSHCIPRQIIADEILLGLGSPGVTPCPKTATIFDESLEPYNYSITTAKNYLRLAEYDVPLEPSILVGINFPIILGIISLIVGCLIFINKRKIGANQ
ncbi:MAG: hypothetical protein HZR80_16660 [Candidatus Heimdallarchaeota archaeon]